jgi:hypothetical protein
MKLSGIEIVVGEPPETLTAARQLSCHMSFTSDAGEECWRRHESLVNEQVLYHAADIARLVSDLLRGLLAEDADRVLTRETPAASRPGEPDRSSRAPI